jgi:PPK2 family polyphosphate:nucleotide phosphotransferase
MAKKLSPKQRRKRLDGLLTPYRVTKGKGFRLSQIKPDDSRGVKTKEEAQEYLQLGISRLADRQDKLYAQDQWGVLLVFQAMDAAGKDGAIKHVMSGINPQGCQVYSFKGPSAEELDHDFLWRTNKALPERGRIGIFNRSYYEEVLVVRVHQEILKKQKLPQKLITKKIWDERYEDIRAFERYLARQGYLILKFFLHVSKKAQKERFLERLDRPEKNWKFSLADAQERARRPPPTPRGTSCPRTRSGSPGSWSPPPWTRRSTGWTSLTRRWTRRRGRSSWRPARRSTVARAVTGGRARRSEPHSGGGRSRW